LEEPLNRNPQFAVTTSRRPAAEQVKLAKEMALEFKVPFLERNDLSVEAMSKYFRLAGLVVVSARKVSYIAEGQEFFFHPGLAGLRIKQIKNGKTDQMIDALSLQPGDAVLDCTLGLGADAIVASYVSGPGGRVTGIESSIIISALVRRGLSTYPEEEEDIALAMRRVGVINAGHKEYLASLAPSSFDVVYFDPMFRSPRRHSPAMNAMRSLANPLPVDLETIELASKVAAKRVVLKERRGCAEFERLGFKKICGGKYAPVVYGVLERQGVEQ
jgi:hypothetical protein